jgi:DNA-binding SARP family transcriptional activator
VEFRLLGPLEVRGAREAYEPPAGKERALLAVLLLRANQPVSSDELVTELWGDSAPTKPGKNVQSYISRLRRRLGDDRIATTPAGYVIRVDPDELDVERFERLAAEGAAKLAAGETARAQDILTEALALWRGPAFADFRFDSFAQAEIRRLESVRDSVVADRIDAVLARSPERVIPELESLIASKPLWERPRAQLMLALYRTGRQSEALDLYRDTRTLLGAELGIEPSPELQQLQRAILNQDPALIPPSLPSDARPTRRRRRRGLFAVAAGLLAVLVAGAAVLALDSGTSPSATVKPDSVALLDPATGDVVAQTPVAGSPSQLALAGGRIWVWGEDSRAISELDSSTLALRHELAPGGFADELARGPHGLWMLDGDSRKLIEVDPAYAGVKSRTTIPPPRGGGGTRGV